MDADFVHADAFSARVDQIIADEREAAAMITAWNWRMDADDLFRGRTPGDVGRAATLAWIARERAKEALDGG